jgi:tRNA-dihydrouridine synthase C
MEGVVDDLLRDLLTQVGGIDWCVTEFIRVTDQLLPRSCFRRLAPELENGARTPAGVPVRVQLLGSDPASLAENAVRACELGAPVIDLNFGCPAKTVNRSRGGAILLREPELLHDIVRAVRAAVPSAIPVTAKMRIGYEDTGLALDCARALADGGSAHLVVHARTKLDGYKPPAYWEWIARVADAVDIPVIANGEIWCVEDWQRCRRISGIDDVMLGRGLIARPDLACQIAAAYAGNEPVPMNWDQIKPLLHDYWKRLRLRATGRHAPGRLKQWLHWLARSFPEAAQLFVDLRRETDCEVLDRQLQLALDTQPSANAGLWSEAPPKAA